MNNSIHFYDVGLAMKPSVAKMSESGEIAVSPGLRQCRLCFDNKSKLVAIFDGRGCLINVANTIREILHYEVFEGDHFPPFVCADCLDRLYEFKAFKTKCDLRKESYELLLGVRTPHSNEVYLVWLVRDEEMPVPVKLVEVSTGKEVFYNQEYAVEVEKDPLSCEDEELEDVPYCGSYSDDYIIPAQMVEVVQSAGEAEAPKKPRKRKASAAKTTKRKAQNRKRKKVLKVAIGALETSVPPLELVLREEKEALTEQLAKDRRKAKREEKDGIVDGAEEVPTRQEDDGECPGEESAVPPSVQSSKDSPVDQIPEQDGLAGSVVPKMENIPEELGETEFEQPEEAVCCVPSGESAIENGGCAAQTAESASVVPCKKGRPKKESLGRPKRTLEVDPELELYLNSGVVRSTPSCHLPNLVRQPYFEAIIRKSQEEAAREKKRQYCREYNRRKIAKETPEERERRLAGMRAYMKKLTERRRRETKFT